MQKQNAGKCRTSFELLPIVAIFCVASQAGQTLGVRNAGNEDFERKNVCSLAAISVQPLSYGFGPQI